MRPDIVALVDELLARIEEHAGDALPKRYRRYLYQEHRGLSHEDAPALEIFPEDATIEVFATDGTMQVDPTITVGWHEPSAYGAKTSDRRSDERVAQQGLERAQAILEAVYADGHVITLDSGREGYLTPARSEWGLTEGLTWTCELEITVEWLQ